ncbi:MAG: type II secretion system protein [Lachnospiraceae bacterium]|nr:type II secretion system protein [Lachnospiraceae bacterium]
MFSRKGKKNNSGFTLVEMVVVLVILGILASAAVYGIISYINMTRYNNNQENAETIYQSAQASLNHMSENGTLEGWAKSLTEGLGTPDGYDSDNPAGFETSDNIYNKAYFDFFGSDTDTTSLPGQSAHMRYAVTYSPSYTPGAGDAQSKCIYDLILQDFKATDILKGMITIEFDVEKALDASGNVRYSASVYSVFYDSKRTSWDAVARNNIGTLIVPFRNEDYRYNTSFIGYIAGRNGQMVVDSVFVPAEAEVGEFSLRNGETLDLTWSLRQDDEAVTGKPEHIHYTFALYDADKDNILNQKPFSYLVVNENSLFEGIPYQALYSQSFCELLKFTDSSNPLYLAKDEFASKEGLTRTLSYNTHGGSKDFVVVYTKESVTDKRGVPLTVYRASIHTIGKVYVHNVTSNTDNFNYNNEYNNLTSNNFYEFPLTISYEVYDAYGTTISERLSYTLSLDAMMGRNVIDFAKTGNSTTERLYNFSINRLLNGSTTSLTDNTLPVNMYVSMQAESDNFGTAHAAFNGPTDFSSDLVIADRALDDPVYYVSEGKYNYVRNAAFREAGAGHAVVNTYFGDLGEGSDGTKPTNENKNGTLLSNQNSVITCYRHLYNIRMLDRHSSYDNYNYSIVRDLNWYTIDKHLGTEKYYSDVVVYSALSHTSDLQRYSPLLVPAPGSGKYCGDELGVVSFPTLLELNAKSTLVAKTNDLTGETSVINNVQMRMSSFFDKSFKANNLFGYGLININYGTIINIRANGLTLLINNLPEGAPDDRADIANAVSLMLSGEIDSTDEGAFHGSKPIGGLVGTNAGTLGSNEDLPAEENTIRFSNCVTASLFTDAYGNWHLYRLTSCGGIVGDNGGTAMGTYEGYMYGHIEATGHFVSANRLDVGAVVGYTRSDIDAFIKVDNRENDPDKIIVDLGSVSSMLYCTTDAIGGAIGSTYNYANFRQGPGLATLNVTEGGDGVIAVAEDPLYNSPNIFNRHEYAVDVYLDDNSYIICKTDEEPKDPNREAGIGGAVGRIRQYGGGDLSIHVVNNGVIASSNGTHYVKNLGGAIGIIWEGSVSNTYISVFNTQYSRIGTYNGSTAYGYAHTTGGAVGKIKNLARTDDTSNIIISVSNNGVIIGDCRLKDANGLDTIGQQLGNGNCDKNTGGIGGAVGAITGAQNTIPICNIRAHNNGILRGYTTSYEITENRYKNVGVGGTIGYVEFMPKSGNLYCFLEQGKEIRAIGNNAGGVIGSQTNILSNPGTSFTHITADLQNGSSVVSTASNAGGAIGNAYSVTSRMQIRAIISGTVTIKANADAGGTCGLLRPGSGQNVTNDYSEIILQQGTGNSFLYVRACNESDGSYTSGNENAGGLIGNITDNSAELKTAFILPSQTSGNTVVINVESFDNAGGMIGHMYSNKHVNPEMTVTLHPMTGIKAYNDNAGGCIGLLEQSGNQFRSNITVTDAQGIDSAYTPVIQAGNTNAGGLIGESKCLSNTSFTGNLLLDSTNLAIMAKSNVGGCFGNLKESGGKPSLYGTLTVNSRKVLRQGATTPSCIVISASDTAGENFGGVIGYAYNVNIYAAISCNTEMIVISGINNVGGCIGWMEKGNFATSSGHIGSIALTGEGAVITGNNNVGGCMGYISEVGNVSNNILFKGESCSITGNSGYAGAGGCIGKVYNCQFQNNSLTEFSGKDTNVTGGNDVGGLIGLMHLEDTYYPRDNTKFTFNGESCSVSGNENVGGCIGRFTDNQIKGTVTFSPVTSCTVSGNNNIGGCFGNVTAGSKNDPFTKRPVVSLANCSVTVSGSGCTGGVIGRLSGGKTYQGSSVTLENSTYNVISSNSAAGGHIGYIAGTVIGTGAELYIYSRNGSTFNITGRGAGGMIGQADSDVSAKKMVITPENSSSVNVSATGTDSGAGGLIGVNTAVLTLPNEDASIATASGLNISAANGYAGYIAGLNSGTLKGTGTHTYTLIATIGSCKNSSAAPEEMVIGRNTGSVNIKYKINGTTYTLPATP